MAGKTNFTIQPPATSSDDDYAFAPREAKAFCLGMSYRHGGTLIDRPNTDNPFTIAQELGNFNAWQKGWEFADAAAGSVITDTLNCAIGAAGVPI